MTQEHPNKKYMELDAWLKTVYVAPDWAPRSVNGELADCSMLNADGDCLEANRRELCPACRAFSLACEDYEKDREAFEDEGKP